MIAVLGKSPKPTVVWQKQFDGFDETLRKLAMCDWDAVPESWFWEYFLDLSYMELQPDLFRHLFPSCLKFWHETLMRNDSASRGDADFHLGLVHGKILTTMMSEQESQRALDFFVDSFLDRVDLERGFIYERKSRSAYAWIERFNTLGIIGPIIPKIWTEWWMLDSPGKAVSAIMYASGLIYLEGENPIYLPWTKEEGGGGPYMTAMDASIFDHAWLASNLDFFRNTLTYEYLADQIALASIRLNDQPEVTMAQKIATDVRKRKGIIETRVSSMIKNLGKLSLEQELWH